MNDNDKLILAIDLATTNIANAIAELQAIRAELSAPAAPRKATSHLWVSITRRGLK
jgi:hypothetical protein